MVDIKRIAFCLVFLLVGANSFSSMSETPAICNEKEIAKKESISKRISDVGKRAMRPFAKFYYGLVGNEKECSSSEILGIRVFTFIALLASQSMLTLKQTSAQRRVPVFHVHWSDRSAAERMAERRASARRREMDAQIYARRREMDDRIYARRREMDARLHRRAEVDDDRYPFYWSDMRAAESVAERLASARRREIDDRRSGRVAVDVHQIRRDNQHHARSDSAARTFEDAYDRYPVYRPDRSAAESMAERRARFNSNNKNSNYHPAEDQGCISCFDTRDEDSSLGPIPCKNPHSESICDECLATLALNGNRCPMCRAVFNF